MLESFQQQGEKMDVRDALRHWQRKYRTGYVKQTCGSAEKNYRPPKRQWMTLDEIADASEPLDHHLADATEAAWKAIPIRRYRQILRLSHMTAAPDYVIAKQAGTKVWRLKSDYDRAVRALAERLATNGLVMV